MASTVTGLSGSGAAFGAALSLANIGTWIGQVNDQMANTSTLGYKSRRTNFKGNHTTHTMDVRKSGAYGAFRSEDFLTLGDTTLDFSQGTLVNSYSPHHAAINGQGTFILTDDESMANRLTYYTRDGEFHVDPEGYLRTLEGLYVTNPEYSAGQLGPEQNPWHPGFGANWEYREKFRIENKDPFFTMPAQSIAQFDIPLSNMLDEEKVRADLEDVRIVHIPTGTELPRNVSISSDGTKASFTFRLAETIPKLGASEDYYIYYGNENAAAAPLDTTITPGGVPTLPFSDNFDDGVVTWVNQPATTENWIEANAGGGANPAANGDTDFEFRQTVNTGFETKAVTGNANWNDYRFSVTMGNLDNDNDSVFVYGRWDEATNTGYRFALIGNTTVNSRRIQKVVNGAVTATLYQDNVLPDPGCTPGGGSCPFWDYRVEMEFVGNAVRLFQDGSLVAEAFDNTAPILAGKVGVGNSSQSAWYDDVNVDPPVQNAEITLLGRDGLVKFDHNVPIEEQLGWTSTFPQYTGLEVTHYGSTIYQETQFSGPPDYGNTIAQAGSTITTINVAAGDGVKFKAGDQIRVTGGRYANTSATGGTSTNLNVTAGTGVTAGKFQVGDTVTITGGALNNIVHTTTISGGNANQINLTNQLVDSQGNPVTPTGGEYIQRVHHGDNFEVVSVTAVNVDTLTVTPLLIPPDPGSFVYLERQDIIVGEAVEASNSTEAQLIPELIKAQQMAESLSKIILVSDSTMKVAFDLIR